MAKYVIFKTEVPHFKKEGKMERKEKWLLWLEMAASSPSNWCIWVAKLEKRVTTMKNHNSIKVYEKA